MAPSTMGRVGPEPISGLLDTAIIQSNHINQAETFKLQYRIQIGIRDLNLWIGSDPSLLEIHLICTGI